MNKEQLDAYVSKQKKNVSVIYAYKNVFSTEEGQVVLDDLCKSCGIGRLSYDLGEPSLNDTIFREGMRSVILRILRTMEIDPEEYIEQIKKTYVMNQQ